MPAAIRLPVYHGRVDRDDLRQFALRDWAAVAEEKARYWAAQKDVMSSAEALRLGAELRAYVSALRPDWPTDAEREADLDSHARVASALRAVSHTSR